MKLHTNHATQLELDKHYNNGNEPSFTVVSIDFRNAATVKFDCLFMLSRNLFVVLAAVGRFGMAT